MVFPKKWRTTAYACAAALGVGTLAAGTVAADATARDTRTPKPRHSSTQRPFPKPTPKATITIQPALLVVTARAARTDIPRSAKVTLVEEATTGPGQSITTRTKVVPKRARSAIKVWTTDKGQIVVRTEAARKARVRVWLRADGPENTPKTWTRKWHVR